MDDIKETAENVAEAEKKEDAAVQSEKNTLEIDDSVLSNKEELERVMEAVIYVEGSIDIARLRNLFKCENSDIIKIVRYQNEMTCENKTTIVTDLISTKVDQYKNIIIEGKD